MYLHRNSYLLMAFFLFSTVNALWAQPEPIFDQNGLLQKSSGVWSRNIELICPVPLWNGINSEEFQLAKVNAGTETRWYVAAPVTRTDNRPSRLTLVDVSNPRWIRTSLEIMADNQGEALNIGQMVVWTDTSTGRDTSGHTFAVCRVDRIEPDDLVEVAPGIFARFLVLDLTAALERVDGAPSIVVDIGDVNSRAATVNGSAPFNDVYLGYIPQDWEFMVRAPNNPISSHTVSVEPEQGIFIISPLRNASIANPHDPNNENIRIRKGFIDLFDLRTIATHPNAHDGAGVSDFVIPTRITTTGGVPIECLTPGGDTDLVKPHETHGDVVRIKPGPGYHANRILLTVASAVNGLEVQNFREDGSAYQQPLAGGAVIFEVDFDDPANAVITPLQHFPYHTDRRTPDQRFSNDPNWSYQISHTVDHLHVDMDTHYMLTMDELASPRFHRLANGDPGTSLVNDNGVWTGSSPSINTDGDQNDLVLGNFLRVWGSSDHKTFEIADPIGAYDVPERTEADRLAGRYEPALSLDEIETVDASANGSFDRAPNTAHHVRTIRGVDEAYVAWYSQGVRVIGFEDFTPENPRVREKAYFDFYPTLSYDPASPYFYMNWNHPWVENDDFYEDFLRVNNYYQGTFDVYPDVLRSGNDEPQALEADEKFLYAYSYGENLLASETIPRNWLYQGGFFILRYFDDQIGGDIHGWAGSSNPQADPANNRPYREVNLDGVFSVEREVNIIAGATVNLLEETRLTTAQNGATHTINVFGTLNVNTHGAAEIEVPIVVHAGGRLVIKKGAEIILNRIDVNEDGEWLIEAGSHTRLNHVHNVCNGRLRVLGEPGNPATVTAIQPGARIRMTGNPDLPAQSCLEIRDAIFNNIPILVENVTIKGISHSDFNSSSQVIPAAYLLEIRFDPDVDLSPVNIDNCSFTDLDGQSPISYPRVGQYNQRGILLYQIKQAEITNSSFSYLGQGILSLQSERVRVEDNNFTTCGYGVSIWNGQLFACSNDFLDLDFGITISGGLGTTLYDNQFTLVAEAIAAHNSNRVFLKGNHFLEYRTGLLARNTVLQMTDEVWMGGSGYLRFGRNHFFVSSDFHGPSGGDTNDIILGLDATAALDCGYNGFSLNSSNHILGPYPPNPIPSMPVSNNRFPNPSGFFEPRVTNANAFGLPLYVSEHLPENCDGQKVTGFCGDIIRCGTVDGNRNDGHWAELKKTDSLLGQAYTDARLMMQELTLAPTCRLDKARDAFDAAVLGADPHMQLEELVLDYALISSVPENDGLLKRGALLLEGQAHVRLGNPISARTAFQTLLTDHPNSTETLSASWMLMYMDAQDLIPGTAAYDQAMTLLVEAVYAMSQP